MDVKVGDFWNWGEDNYAFRRIMDLVDTGIDKIVYWKDHDRCTGRCTLAQFEEWKRMRRAELTKRQSEKGFRLEHNERYKKCGNYALGNAGLPKTELSNELFPAPTTDGSSTSTPSQTETNPVLITCSEDGLISTMPSWEAIVEQTISDVFSRSE